MNLVKKRLYGRVFDGIRKLLVPKEPDSEAARCIVGISRQFSKAVQHDAMTLARSVYRIETDAYQGCVTSAPAIRTAALIRRQCTQRRTYLNFAAREVGLAEMFGKGAKIKEELRLCDVVIGALEGVR